VICDQPIKTKGSLCSGTGALDSAVPGELAWTAESNESATSVLKRAHPGVTNYGDITTADWASATPVDLLTSGDPCQSISVAGRQNASEDERFLWPHVMKVIDIVKPREIFLENVANIVSVALVKGAPDWRGQRGSVLKLRLDNLREAGYAVRWTVLGACAVGAPHHRHRWFLRAWHVGADAPAAERIHNRCGAPRGTGRLLLPSPTTADGSGGPGRSAKRDGGDNLRTAVTLLPTPRASDVGTPGRRSSEGWRPQLGQAVLEGTLLPTPVARDGEGRSEGGEEYWGRFAGAVALWEQVTGTSAPEPTEPNSRGGRRLNPALSEWMMGLPRGFLTDHLSRNEALRCAGNGVVPLQATAAWDLLAPGRVEDGALF
jgi:DNA (cytosine-5)-methyltransferase 1